MGIDMHDYLHDDDGRKLTSAERLAKLNVPYQDQTQPVLPVPEGTLAERQQQRRQVDNLREEIDAEVERKANEGKPAENPFNSRLAEVRDKLKWAAPNERAGLERRLAMFGEAAEKWELEKVAEAKLAAFNANEGIILLRENAEAFARSHKASHPDATDHDVALILAIAESNSFREPEQKMKAYWNAMSDLHTKQVKAEEARLTAAAELAAKATSDAAHQAARLEALKAQEALARKNSEQPI